MKRVVKTFTLTPKRIAALRYIDGHPGCYVGAVAQEILAGPHREKRGLWSQQATRAGAGYCIQLRDQGLVTIDTYVDSGYGRVRITPAGIRAVANLCGAAALTLDEAIEKGSES